MPVAPRGRAIAAPALSPHLPQPGPLLDKGQTVPSNVDSWDRGASSLMHPRQERFGGGVRDTGPLSWKVSLRWRLICERTREGCFQAFRLNHWLGFAVFAGVVAGYGLR